MAQIAALGTVTGVLLGYEVGKDGTALYFYSLAFTFLGAFIFSMTKMRGEKVPHEAIIGIVYAVAFAATILVLARSPLGPQELDRIIKGELLWVQKPLVLKTGIIYLIIGVFHFLFRKKFIPISVDAVKAEESGLNVRLWDFLFYMSFGFVITSSVAIAGAFLVFSYLVIPAVGAMLFSEKLSNRLIIGWAGGAITSLIGIKLSWNTGLPTSPLVVVLLALALIIGAIIRYIRVVPDKSRAALNIGVSAIIFALFIGGIFFFRKAEEDPLEHTLHMLTSKLGTDRQTALINLESYVDKKERWLTMLPERLHDDDAEVRNGAVKLIEKMEYKEALPQVLALLKDKSDVVKVSAINAARALGDMHSASELVQASKEEDDVEMQMNMLEAALELGTPEAIPLLIQIMQSDGIFADEAYHRLRAHVQFEFTRNEAPKIKDWWNKNGSKLQWDEKTKMFGLK